MFEYTEDEEGYIYYLFKEKLSNGQTLEIKFWEYEDFFYPSLLVYSKRKTNITDFETTGKVGIKSLLLAKLGIKLFIEFLKEERINKNIVVHWADNRRRNIYYRGLKELGFKFKYLVNNEGSSTKYLVKEFKNGRD